MHANVPTPTRYRRTRRAARPHLGSIRNVHRGQSHRSAVFGSTTACRGCPRGTGAEKDKRDYHSRVAAPKRKKRAGTPLVTELHAETEEKGADRDLRAEAKQDWHLPTGRPGEKRQKKQGAAADKDGSWLERGCRRRRRGYPNVISSSSEGRSLPKLY